MFQIPDIMPTFSTMTRIFGDCFECLTSFQHFQQWQEYLKIVSNALLHSDIYPNDKNIWRLLQVPDIIPTFSTMTRIFEDCIKCLTTLRHLHQWQRIFGDCFKCLTSFQHFQQWQEYLKIVSNALLHSHIYTNDKNIWRLFQVPEIIPTFSTMTRIFEDCIKCHTTLTHLHQWQEYLEIVSSAWHHSNIFNNEKNIWRLYQMPYYTQTFTPNDKNIWRLFQMPDIIPTFSTMTRIFEDCIKCDKNYYTQHIYTNDKNNWGLFQVPDIIPTFSTITRIFEDCIQMPYYTHTFTPMTRIFGHCYKCLTSFQHFQNWQEYLKIVSNALLHSHICTNDKNIWRLFQVPDIIPTFSTMTRIFEYCIKCLTTLRHLHQWQEYLENVTSAWHHSNISKIDKNIWRLYQMPYYTHTFAPMTRILGHCFKCLTSFKHFQQWQEYLKIVSNALQHSDIYTNDKNIWRLFQVPDIIPTLSTMTRIFEDCIKFLTTLTHLYQWQEYLEIVSSAWHYSNIFNNWQEYLKIVLNALLHSDI